MLTALAIAGVLVALFLAAALATRESEQLAPVARDAADVVLPDGPLAADDVRRLRFGLSLRGYRMSEVDAVLERFARELEGRVDGAVREQGPPSVVEAAEPVVLSPETAPDTHPVVLAGPDEPGTDSPAERTGSFPVVMHPTQAPVVSDVVARPAPQGEQPDRS